MAIERDVQRAEKLKDLKEFAANFKLKYRIPDDVLPLMAKDREKQITIQRKAEQAAKAEEMRAEKCKNEKAAYAVFGTYELLEGILIYLSPKGIAKAMRVSKNWHAVISRSPSLHDARILVPLDRTSPGDYPRKLDMAIPLYHAKLNIQDRQDGIVGYDRGPLYREESEPGWFYKNIFDINIGEHDVAERTHIEDSYVTTPPCQALSLRLLNFRNYCTVYNKECVRVRDVQNAGRGLWNTAECYLDPRFVDAFKVFVEFQTIKAKRASEEVRGVGDLRTKM